MVRSNRGLMTTFEQVSAIRQWETFIMPSETLKTLLATRLRVNSAHTRQSRPDSGLGVQMKVLKAF